MADRIKQKVLCMMIASISFGGTGASAAKEHRSMRTAPTVVSLPAPKLTGALSLESALAKRRSVREFQKKPLTQEMLSQLLWSIQGITHGDGYRTAPSAGALFPLEVYVATADGLFHFTPERNELTRMNESDLRNPLCQAALGQESVSQAPAVFVIAAVYQRTAIKYGAHAERYVHLECGHASQNLLLQAVSLGLGAVPIGAFRDSDVARVLRLSANEKVVYLIPVGYAR